MDLREYPERLAYLLIRSFHISVLSLMVMYGRPAGAPYGDPPVIICGM